MGPRVAPRRAVARLLCPVDSAAHDFQTYQPDPGQSACEECTEGTSAATAGSSSCSACDAGTFSGTGAVNCTRCVPGKYSLTSASACSNCSLGFHAIASGASTCTACAAGKVAVWGVPLRMCRSCRVACPLPCPRCAHGVFM